MKKLIAVFLTIAFSFGLVGCGAEEGTEVNTFPLDEDEFYVTIMENNTTGIVYRIVDKSTRVQYIFIDEGYEGGMTVLLDADGKPLLYEGELE